MSRLLAVAVLFALVVAALLWLQSGGVPAADASAQPTGASATTPGTARAEVDAAAARATASGAQRTELGAAPGAHAPTLRARVVQKATQQPVAGAKVFLGAATSEAQGTRAAEAQAQQDAAPAITDSNGEVAFATASLAGGALLFCAHDGLWAEAIVYEPLPDAPVLLQLEAELRLRVLVLGPDERPVEGAPVTVAGTDRMNGAELLFGNNLEQRTGTDGLAAFEHLQARVHTTSAVVLLDLPLPVRVLQNVDLTALPPQPLVLHLPATGALTVQLVLDGGPFEPEGFVRLELEDRTPGTAPPTKHEYAMRHGRLELPHLALGRLLHATVVSEYCTGAQAIEGPTQPGERRSVQLAVHRQPMLTGRLVDAARAPLRRESWVSIYAAGDWTSYRVYFETDGDGRFRMPLPPVFRADSERLAVLTPEQTREPPLMARVELPEWVLREPRDLDLGDVTAAPPPVLVDGTVVDEGGRPVAGAALRVQQHRDGIRETAVDTHATSAADGAFAIRAMVPQDGLHLVAECSRRQTRDLPFTAGARNLTVVMPATGRIEMPVALDDGLPLRLLLASCIDASGTTTMGSHLAIRRGTLVFDDLQPGSATLMLRCVGETEPVWHADAVPVRGGETTTLPAVDLRARLHAVVIRTVDDEHRPVLEATARLDPDGPGAREQPLAHDGRIELLLHRAVTVAVHAPGRATAVLPLLERDAEAVLHAGLSLVLQTAEATPPPPLRVRAVLEAVGAAVAEADARDRQWRDGGDRYELADGRALRGATSAPLDGDRRAAIVVPAPGSYRLRWRIERGDDVRWVEGQPAQLTVDGATTAVLPVSLPAAALAAALRGN